MMIKVLFFGATADATNSRHIEMEVARGETVESLISRLREVYPRLTNQQLLASVNEQYVEFSMSLVDGDEVAIFTSVSGG